MSGATLKALRAAAGVSQSELAELIGVTPQAVAARERAGHVRAAEGDRYLLALVVALNVDRILAVRPA